MSLERIFAGEGWAEDLEENLEAMREGARGRADDPIALEGD